MRNSEIERGGTAASRMTRAGRGYRFMAMLPVIIVILASLALFASTLSNGLVVDDVRQIRNNRLIRSTASIPEIMTTGVWDFEGRQSSYYRPFMRLLYMAVYSVAGAQPWGYHLLNLLFHAASSVLVVLILRRLMGHREPPHLRLYRSAPLFGALLFAAHPIHTEAVAWAAGIADLSMACFYLLSIYFYISRDAVSGRPMMIASLVALFLATLCKEHALTLTAAIVAYDLLFGGRGGRGRAVAGCSSSWWPASILS